MSRIGTKKYFLMLGVIWAVSIVAFVLVYLLLISPQNNMRRQLSGKIQHKRSQYESVFALSRLETRQKMRKELEEREDQLDRYAIPARNSANITFDISRIANAQQVSSFSIKSRDAEELPNCDYLAESRMYATFDGRFDQFAKFLNALERNSPLVFIDAFSISRDDEDQSKNPVTMELSIFVRKEQQS